MNKLRIEVDNRNRVDYRRTLAQRKLITSSLRQRYDSAKASLPEDEDFAVSFDTSTLPTPLTEQNKKYLSGEYGIKDIKDLFGKLAVRSTIEIDEMDEDFIISLLHTRQIK